MRRPVAHGATGCSAIGEALGESIAGSALKHRRLLCVEHTGPWEHDTPAVGPLAGAAALAERCAALGIRVQQLRRTQRPAAPGPATVLLGWADPGDRRAERLVLEHPDAVAGLDLERFAEPGSAAFGEPVVEPVWLVCTHGAKDPCCVKRGLPLVRALRASGQDVWQTSHTGGDRFAANVIVLPHGAMLGRVPAGRAAAVAALVTAGRLPLEHLRGELGAPQHEQAAVVAVRHRLGVDGPGAVVVVGSELDGRRATVVVRSGDGRTSTVLLEHRDTGLARPTTCRAVEGKDPGAWEVVVRGA